MQLNNRSRMNLEKIFYVVISTILVIVLVLISYLFTPFGIENNSNRKLATIYYVDHISTAHQKVIDIFNKKYEGQIKVETINLSFEKFSTNERKELLARYLRSKSSRIDIFSVDQIWVPRFARWGVPIQNYLDSNAVSSLIPNALQTCYFKDTLLAVPLYIDIAVMFYRDDLLKKLPDYNSIVNELSKSITWENFIKLRQRINSQNPFYTFQADDYEGLLCTFTELMAGQNKLIADKEGNIFINTPEGKKSLQLLVDLIYKYKVSPEEVTYLKENESFKFFAEHNGYFLRSWSSMFDDEVEYLTDEMRKNLEMAPVPHFENTKPVSVYGGWNLMISKFSGKIPEVIKFVKFLMSEESQKIMFEEGGYLPTNLNVYNDSDFTSKHKEIIFFKNLFKTGVHRPFIEGYTNVSDVLSYYLNSSMKGEIKVEEALRQAEKKILEKSIMVK